MPRHSKKQFNKLLDKATTEMKDQIAKREIIPFRLDYENCKRLQQIAVGRKKHVGALVRDWVIEKINEEYEQSKPIQLPSAIRYDALVKEISHLLDKKFLVLEAKISDEDKKIDQLRDCFTNLLKKRGES